MDSEQGRKAEEAAQRYKAQLKKSAFPTIGMVYSAHQGPNRAQRRAVKYKPAPRKHAQTRQQNIAFA